MFGKINTPIQQKQYVGLETETTKTIVDNTNGTIAVNVKELNNLIETVNNLREELNQIKIRLGMNDENI